MALGGGQVRRILLEDGHHRVGGRFSLRAGMMGQPTAHHIACGKDGRIAGLKPIVHHNSIFLRFDSRFFET